MKKIIPFIVSVFGGGKEKEYEQLGDPAVKLWIGDISGKVNCRRSSHTRWKKSRAMGYTKRSRG